MAFKDKKKLLNQIDELTKMAKYFILLYGVDEIQSKKISRLWRNKISANSFFIGCADALRVGFENKWFDVGFTKEEEQTEFRKFHAFVQEKFATLYGDEIANKLVCVVDAVCINLSSLFDILAEGVVKGMPKKELNELLSWIIRLTVLHLPKKDAVGFLKLVIDEVDNDLNWDKYPKWK